VVILFEIDPWRWLMLVNLIDSTIRLSVVEKSSEGKFYIFSSFHE